MIKNSCKILIWLSKFLANDIIKATKKFFQIIFLLPCSYASPLVYFANEDPNKNHLHFTLAFGFGVFLQALVLQIIAICLRKRAAINAISNLHLENEIQEDFEDGK